MRYQKELGLMKYRKKMKTQKMIPLPNDTYYAFKIVLLVLTFDHWNNVYMWINMLISSLRPLWLWKLCSDSFTTKETMHLHFHEKIQQRFTQE